MIASGGVLSGAPAAAQALPPNDDWATLETVHFRVTFPRRLEAIGREAAAAAERAHAVLSAELARAPEGPVELVVTDHVDYTNGYATPFPSNRVVVFARPPLDMHALAYARDWIELVVAHELVHVFHADVAGPVGRAIRTVFGRLPFFWPVFPVIGTPAWNLEGLATHYESRLTGAGRVHGTFHDMVVRTAVLEEGLPPLDDVTTPSPVWPGPQASYIYGASFMRWLAERFGPDVHGRLIAATAGSVLPTFLFFDEVAGEVTGQDFGDLYDAWRDDALRRANATRDSLVARGLIRGEPVAETLAPFALHPRVGPAGDLLAFSADDYRSDPATRLLTLETGDIRSLARRNQADVLLGPAAWLPDGSGLITAQLDFDGPYHLLSDLWRVGLDGSETRITRGARLAQPDVSPDGRSIIAVQSRDGAMPLVMHDLRTGITSLVAHADAGEGFTGPRWSPDGRTVAAARFRDGRTDLVLVDVATGAVTPLTADDALDGAPAWSPDGRYLVFWSDRSGIPNLYAATRRGEVRQITSVLGGAFDPDVSPDGRWIFYAAYHAGGWRLERLPFEPDAWRRAPAPTHAYRPALLDSASAPPGQVRSFTRYSPLPSMGPEFWAPAWTATSIGDDALHFLGAYSTGWDVLDRHRWAATAAFEVGSGRLHADASWRWRGLGVPELTASAGRSWDAAGFLRFSATDTEALWLREDRVALDALFRHPRWRASAFARAGLEFLGRRYDLHRGGAEGDSILDLAELDHPAALLGAVVGVGWANARAFPYSISLEDGFAVSVAARRWWRARGFETGYDQIQGRLTAYRGFPWWGFADHVVAGRLAVLTRTGPDAVPTSIGGTSGDPASLADVAALAAPSFLPVRGYADGARTGTRAWTASAEYRVPLHLTGWRGDFFGLSFTSLSGSVFADGGDAWCPEDRLAALGCAARPSRPLLSAGAELSIDFGVLHSVPLRLRGGLAIPFTDLLPDDGRPAAHPRNWTAYLAFGPSF